MPPPRQPANEIRTVDIRGGWPSASAMHRLIQCHASFLREKKFSGEDTDVAIEGRIIHSALEGDIPINTLSDWQRWMVERCTESERVIVEALGIDEDNPQVKITSERRIWFNDSAFEERKPNEVNFSGQYDKRYYDIGTGRVILLDYKTGRNEVETAPENAQLAALAVLEFAYADHIKIPVKEVYVGIIQPLASWKHSLARYTRSSAYKMWGVLKRHLLLALEENAPAAPGDHCSYCRARGACKEALEYATGIIPIAEVQAVKIHRKTEYILPPLTVNEIRAALPKIPVARKILDAIVQQGKQLCRDGQLPEYELTDGDNIIGFTNILTAWKRLGRWLGFRTSMQLVSVKVGELDTAVKLKLGSSKEAAREAWIERAGDVVYISKSQPELRLKKTASSKKTKKDTRA